MDFDFSSNKLRRQLETTAQQDKAFGDRAKPIRLRLGVLKHAPCLADVPKAPPDRCHLLTGNWADHYAVVLKDNWRLIFRPDHDPVPKTEDGGIDTTKVTAIVIVAVADYHG